MFVHFLLLSGDKPHQQCPRRVPLGTLIKHKTQLTGRHTSHLYGHLLPRLCHTNQTQRRSDAATQQYEGHARGERVLHADIFPHLIRTPKCRATCVFCVAAMWCTTSCAAGRHVSQHTLPVRPRYSAFSRHNEKINYI